MANRYYFLGIGGISMSTLAIMLKNEGCSVRGSDEREDKTTEFLKERKIKVDDRLNRKQISKADVVVKSAAIKDDNPFLRYAVKKKKKILSRGQILGQICGGYKTTIAVAGSHGKTTTTAMIYEILKTAGEKPTLHLGGYRIEDGKNYEIDGKDFFVTEACEYYDNFLYLHPQISVITNVEKEHLDYFKTFERQKESFEKFKRQSKVVVDSTDGYSAGRIRHDKDGFLMFKLFHHDKLVLNLHLKICENVNVQNCVYAYQVGKLLGIDDKTIKTALESFKGVKTRFEKVECKYFDNVVCDYAHHPTEIEKAIETARKIFKRKKIITIFQPHTFSRTQALLPEFFRVFKNVEMPIFFRTYSARENESDGMSAKTFAELLKRQNKNARYFDNYVALKNFLLEIDRDCVLLFLGAGDLPNILHKKKFIT